jgi:hypothetical protein
MLAAMPRLAGSRRLWLLGSLAASGITTAGMGLTQTLTAFLVLPLCWRRGERVCSDPRLDAGAGALGTGRTGRTVGAAFRRRWHRYCDFRGARGWIAGPRPKLAVAVAGERRTVAPGVACSGAAAAKFRRPNSAGGRPEASSMLACFVWLSPTACSVSAT